MVDKQLRQFIQELYDRIPTEKKQSDTFLLDFNNDIDLFEPKLGDYVLQNPEEFIEEFKDVVITNKLNSDRSDIIVHIHNLPKTSYLKLDHIRTEQVDKLIQTEGVIISMGSVIENVYAIDYECRHCAHILRIPQNIQDDKVQQPTICNNCGKKTFSVSKEHKRNMLVLVVDDSDFDPIKQIDHISLLLFDDLTKPDFVKKNLPTGQKITITAFLRDKKLKARPNTKEFYLEASWIQNMGNEYDSIQLTPEDIREIRVLSKDPMIYNRFRSSIAPHIFGNEFIKDAIVLQQFGGVSKRNSSGTIARRGNIHMLICGDPGLAKTDMLKYSVKMAPKAKYVTGTSSSAIGLTATVLKDDVTGSWVAQAGALPLYNKGLVAIDELDKLEKTEVVKMNEALSNEQITLDKAGLHRTYESMTSVIAAANPKLGRFNNNDLLVNQVDIDPTFLDRFDLIFIMKEIQDKEVDSKIVDKLFDDVDNVLPEIDLNLIKKYIAYARQTCFPKATEEAKEYIKKLFIDVKYKGYTANPDEIRIRSFSPRYAQSIIRLSEARAKVRLSDTYTVEDVVAVFELMKRFLSDLGYDPKVGEIDIDRITGIPQSQREEIETVKGIIHALQKFNPNGVPINIIIAKAEEYKITEGGVQKAIQVLKKNGDIFEPKYDIFKVM